MAESYMTWQPVQEIGDGHIELAIYSHDGTDGMVKIWQDRQYLPDF